MTDSRTSEYSNFRFYPETLLADVLPRDIENMLLTWHNNRGGRLGGASRFANRLDDMPTVGWGYGALANNQTNDFLALLYGHMASYQSRGSFHSTEQVEFTGEGWYRDYMYWKNLGPNETRPDQSLLRGYANERDLSFCIVSEVIVARLTRWQLVFEDFYRARSDSFSCHHWTAGEAAQIRSGESQDGVCASGGHLWTSGNNANFGNCGTCFCCQRDNKSFGTIWLARAAPKRWFRSAPGFQVSKVPTRFGRISYEVDVLPEGVIEFHVTLAESFPSTVDWKLTWPTNVVEVECEGCVVRVVSGNVVSVDGVAGNSFVVRASLEAMSDDVIA